MGGRYRSFGGGGLVIGIGVGLLFVVLEKEFVWGVREGGRKG